MSSRAITNDNQIRPSLRRRIPHALLLRAPIYCSIDDDLRSHLVGPKSNRLFKTLTTPLNPEKMISPSRGKNKAPSEVPFVGRRGP